MYWWYIVQLYLINYHINSSPFPMSPTGYHKIAQCAKPASEYKCKRCEIGTYTEFKNHIDKCLKCAKCNRKYLTWVGSKHMLIWPSLSFSAISIKIWCSWHLSLLIPFALGLENYKILYHNYKKRMNVYGFIYLFIWCSIWIFCGL